MLLKGGRVGGGGEWSEKKLRWGDFFFIKHETHVFRNYIGEFSIDFILISPISSIFPILCLVINYLNN